jgi:hypothetical protein
MNQPAAEPEPLVAVVILNWNAREETLACLESVARSDWPNMIVIVVDNGSEEDVEIAVKDRRPETIVILNDANLGFAGGMNAGLRRALDHGADYVLLLNNDTIVDKAMVRELVEVARAHPDAGIVSPLELRIETPDVVSSFGLRCDLRRGWQGPPLGSGERDDGQFHGVREVDSSAGTAMLVPASVVREVGLLDESLFLYIEDVDWSLRMRRGGRRIYAALDARLWHRAGSASGGEDSPSVRYYHVRNAYVVSARHAPLGPMGSFLRGSEILALNVLSAIRSRRPTEGVRAVFHGWRDYRRGRLGPRPSAS